MRYCRAFTLLKLLVVIAIMAILVALLLPALSKGKSQASKATDINNLRQIMVAVELYTSDNHGALPPPNWDNGGFPGPQGTNAGWLYTPNMTGVGDRYRPETGLLWPTLKSQKLFVCPSDNLEMERYSRQNQQVQKRR